MVIFVFKPVNLMEVFKIFLKVFTDMTMADIIYGENSVSRVRVLSVILRRVLA